METSIDRHRAPVFIVGPTASGKSAVGARIAALFGGEVISMDSMQVYRDLPVASAQPSREELMLAPHHLLEVVAPDEDFDTARYLDLVEATLVDLRGRDRRPVFVGGTWLYFRALTRGLSPMPRAEPQLRSVLMDDLGRLGSPALHERLSLVDPARAATLHPNDAKRIVRALEIHALGGLSMSESMLASGVPLVGRCIALGLRTPRPPLYAAIEKRVDTMWASGLVDEMRRLHDRLGGVRHTVNQAIGYRQCMGFFDGLHDEDEARRLVARDSRHFARRQLLQFAKEPLVEWIESPLESSVEVCVNAVAVRIREDGDLSCEP